MLVSGSVGSGGGASEMIPYVYICVNAENIGAVWGRANLFPSPGGTS